MEDFRMVPEGNMRERASAFETKHARPNAAEGEGYEIQVLSGVVTIEWALLLSPFRTISFGDLRFTA